MAVSISFSINDFNVKTNFDYINHVLKSVRESQENISWETFQQIADYIRLQMREWTLEYQELDKKFKQIRNRNKKMGLSESSKYEFQDDSVQKMLEEYDMLLTQLFEHTKEGYYLLHRIREAFTGQDIQYSILDKSGKQYYEVTLSLDEILQYTSLSKIKNGQDKDLITNYSLRIESLKNQIKKNLRNNNLQLSMQAHNSALYDQIVENYKAQLNSRKMNLGHIYEVDFYLRNEKAYSGKRLLNWENSSMLISAAVQASKNSTSQLKGGDLGQYQLKNISNASAQLFTSNGIKRSFEKISKILQASNKTQLKNGLMDLFTQKIAKNKGAFTHSLERAANQEAKKGIEDFLKGII